MDQDTEVYIELADDEHPDADAAAEDTARLLMEVRDQRRVSTKIAALDVPGSQSG
ncbi:hypothetical protein [Stieleria bergensis]|uniref:hypothetical protein n=1 Tax=Stieleria bergensis TaxID=2528025 RepID=UPI003AF38B57